MNKDNELVGDLMRGAIDIHLHATPDLHSRCRDEIDLAKEARNAGMRALVSKCAYTDSASRMHYVNKEVKGFSTFGGIVLNTPVGGLNPTAVEASIKFGGKAVWMPSIFSDAHIRHFGGNYATMRAPIRWPDKGVTVLDKDGNLFPVVREILSFVAEHNVMLGTSHLSAQESRLLICEAKRVGVKKIVITHPHNEVPDLTFDEQVEFASQGCILEHCFLAVTPMFVNTTIDEMIRVIKAVGPQMCVMATDFGQFFNPSPVEGLRMFIGALLNKGISPEDIQTMVQTNPARLLGLD